MDEDNIPATFVAAEQNGLVEEVEGALVYTASGKGTRHGKNLYVEYHIKREPDGTYAEYVMQLLTSPKDWTYHQMSIVEIDPLTRIVQSVYCFSNGAEEEQMYVSLVLKEGELSRHLEVFSDSEEPLTKDEVEILYHTNGIAVFNTSASFIGLEAELGLKVIAKNYQEL
jgi:hypothetical protein